MVEHGDFERGQRDNAVSPVIPLDESEELNLIRNFAPLLASAI